MNKARLSVLALAAALVLGLTFPGGSSAQPGQPGGPDRPDGPRPEMQRPDGHGPDLGKMRDGHKGEDFGRPDARKQGKDFKGRPDGKNGHGKDFNGRHDGPDRKRDMGQRPDKRDGKPGFERGDGRPGKDFRDGHKRPERN